MGILHLALLIGVSFAMERRLAAILAADVKGYSRLTERNEEASTANLRMYRAVVEESISAHKGRIFSSAGDGLVAEFPSIVEAIRCAVEIQNEIAERNVSVPENERMQFRIGVNLGDVIAEDDNLYGTGVNVAVRLEQLAEPGGICISQTVYDQVRKIVEIPFEDIGERRLKNIADPVHIYRILPAPLPWHNRFFSRVRRSPRLGAAAGVVVLLVALVGSFYLRQPAALWDALLYGEVPQPTIAVLPFDDPSAANDQQDLADGISDQVRTDLGKFPDLGVMARNLTLKYKGTDIGLAGREPHVTYVLAGGIQRNPYVQVTAELYDASEDNPVSIWDHTYDQQANQDIHAFCDDVARSIVGTLGGVEGVLAEAEFKRVSKKNANSLTAYDYIVKGWHEWSIATSQEISDKNKAAREFFEQARKIEPNNARAYAGLAWTHASDHDFEWEDPETAVSEALKMADKAVGLDSNDYQAHWALGWAYLYHLNDENIPEYDKAIAHYEQALKLNRNDLELLAEMANLLVYIDEPTQAVNQLEEAFRLADPTRIKEWWTEYLGWAYEEARMPSKAVKTLEAVVGLDPPKEKKWLLPSLAAAYYQVGRRGDAKKTVQQIINMDSKFSAKTFADDLPFRDPDQRRNYVGRLVRAGVPCSECKSELVP
jgi:adenylate cyclase